MPKTCFLFGHRDAPAELLPAIVAAAEFHYTRYGIREFIVGQYGNFDHLAMQAIRELKKHRDDVFLILLTPYYRPEHNVELPEGCDGTLYPDGMETIPKRLAIIRANRCMIERADSVICYANHPGNARELLEYALKYAKPANNLARNEFL